jgi:hypothetical protein
MEDHHPRFPVINSCFCTEYQSPGEMRRQWMIGDVADSEISMTLVAFLPEAAFDMSPNATVRKAAQTDLKYGFWEAS